MWVTTDSHRDFAECAARDQQPHLALSSSSTLTRDARSNSSGGQTVTVMQATKSWHGYDWATYIRVLLWFATRRCPFCEREMCSVVVVVEDVCVQQPLQMPFIHNDHMVKQIPAAVAHSTLGNPFCHGLRKLVLFGRMPKLFTVSMTSSLKLASRSKIR
jgi:hypothetical protein